MNPVLLGRQVRESLRDLVRASFPMSSRPFAGAVDRFLDEPRNFLQGPWISVDMPFVQADTSEEPFPEIPMGFRPYAHQMQAFDRLRGPGPRSTLVATGTGSGKSECYLMPMLDHCRTQAGQPGIKAIVIYPMNALATDQARRIARMITENPALKDVRCGLYADAEPQDATSVVTADDVITSRTAMRQNPPDILLTNYKMLDYLLLRGQDRALWEQNGPETLRYLVVDELHTFDGAQGADLALLIRRLKARLGTPEKHLACVGSSATLGSGPDTEAKLIHYAENLFGEPFDPGCLIRETRINAGDLFRGVEFTDTGRPEALREALNRAEGQTQAEAAETIARAVFADGYEDAFDGVDDPASREWRLRLGETLLLHLRVQDILRALAEQGGPIGLAEIAERLGENRLYRRWSEEDRYLLAEAVVALVSWARAPGGPEGRPFLNVRLQIWMREMARMVASLPDPKQGSAGIALRHSDDLDDLDLHRHLPVVHCSRCGTAGHLTQIPDGGGPMVSELNALYRGFFDTAPRSRILYHEPIANRRDVKGRGATFPARVNPNTLVMDPEDPQGVDVWVYDPTTDQGVFDKTCPACGAAQALQILGLRAQRLTAGLTTALFNSEHHEVELDAKPRLLMFSDSVQDAAQRASVAEIRNSGNVMRKALMKSLEAGPRSLADVITHAPANIRSACGDETFVARFIAQDQTWRQEYTQLTITGALSGGLADDVETRLAWEFFSDLTYRSHTSQTLEATGMAAIAVEPQRVDDLADRVHAGLAAALPAAIVPPRADIRALLSGFLDEMRRQGAIDVEYIRRALHNATAEKGLNYFAAQAELGLRVFNVLPALNARLSAAPRPPSRRQGLPGMPQFLSKSATNSYTAWLDRFFLSRHLSALGHYNVILDEILKRLGNDGLLRRIESGKDPRVSGWLLDPGALQVTVTPQTVACSHCARVERVLPEIADWGVPCRRFGCEGVMTPGPAQTSHLERLFATARNHRVVAREHTGILETDDRRALETAFIKGEQAWHPNVISATPTLEMGIDIGDLSALLLCSVPPETANYVQRIGRTGRRDGNSLNITLASGRPHDLQFWEDPSAMLRGHVAAPGLQLAAAAVLRRQAAAFSLDRLVAQAATTINYGKVRQVLKALEDGTPDSFIVTWFDYLEVNGSGIAQAFVATLPKEVRERKQVVQAVEEWLTGDAEGSLRWNVRAVFDAAAAERDALRKVQAEIDAERKRLQRLTPPPADLQDTLDKLKSERGEISRTIKDRINDVEVLRFLTDRGVLPNYAFPEEGVRLKSIITRPKSRLTEAERKQEGGNLILREYVRPAASALSELAPFQTFYAEGREVEINRIDLDANAIDTWRFCPNCAHTSAEAVAGMDPCPKCGDPMWANLGEGGSSGSVVELRTVTASKSEHDATIKDRDERVTRRYVRKMFPAYEPGDIVESYATPADADTPFGFEFIASCEFRDVNFGEERDTPSGRMVAGENLRAFPFQMCRHCGRLQRMTPRDGAVGDHSNACPVKRGASGTGDWLAEVSLMRRFTTEALRIVVPVSGQASDDAIKSFVAAFDVGMRRHFEGKVDHLRSVIVQEKVSGEAGVRSLYIYDSVPGGSGYLRQIAEDPASLRRVFVQARDVLRSCPCHDEGRDGCFRCVKSYRSQFGPGSPSRGMGLQLIEAVLDAWPGLARSVRSINDDLRAGLVTSELERRFVDALVAAYGNSSLKPIMLSGARRAFQLTVPTPNGGVKHWTLEAQVQIDRRFPDLPRKRIDFLFTPVGDGAQKPIVVELDGWEYHASETGTDLETRLAMLRSGKVQVVSLAWDDLSANGSSKPVPNPWSQSRLGPKAQAGLAKLWTLKGYAHLLPARPMVDELSAETPHQSSWLDLRARLEGHHTGSMAPAILSSIATGATPASYETVSGVAGLNEDSRLFLKEAKHFAVLSAGPLKTIVGLETRDLQELLASPQKARLVVVADLPDQISTPNEQRTLATPWRGMWRLITLLQDLPALHVLHPAAPDLSTPSPRFQAATDEDRAWEEALELVDGRALTILTALREAGGAPPDVVGEEIMAGDVVAGEIEIGWRHARFGFTFEKFPAEGWTFRLIDDEDDSPVTADIEAILTHTGQVEA